MKTSDAESNRPYRRERDFVKFTDGRLWNGNVWAGLRCCAVCYDALGKNHPRHNRQWREPAGIWEARLGLQSRCPRFIIETLPKHACSESGSESGAGLCNFAGRSGLVVSHCKTTPVPAKSVGRSVRSETDGATTYFLESIHKISGHKVPDALDSRLTISTRCRSYRYYHSYELCITNSTIYVNLSGRTTCI